MGHGIAGADVGGGGDVVAFVDVGTAAGADGVQDEALGFFGFDSGGAGFALHYADAVEQELGDVGHGDSVFARDAIVGELFQEVAEEEVHAGRGRKIVCAVEESGGDGGGFGWVVCDFFLCVGPVTTIGLTRLGGG